MQLMEEIKQNPRDAFSLAKEKGWDPARLTPSQARWIAVELRSRKQLVKDGWKAVTSRVATTLKLRVVSDKVAGDNEQVCRSNRCGKFSTRSDGAPLCLACQCGSKFLASKWKDAVGQCPELDPETNEPYWDNTVVSSEVGTLVVPVGDHNAQGFGKPQ